MSKPVASECTAGRCVCGTCGSHGRGWPDGAERVITKPPRGAKLTKGAEPRG